MNKILLLCVLLIASLFVGSAYVPLRDLSPPTVNEDGVMFAWPNSVGEIPTGYVRATEYDGYYIYGAPANNDSGAINGSYNHTPSFSDPHLHTISAGSGTENYSVPAGTQKYAAIAHTHGVANSATQSVNFGSTNNSPPYKEVILIKSTSPTAKKGMIGLFDTNTLPTGWAYCNGSTGTNDSNNTFMRVASTGEDAGETGGSVNSTHTAVHNHTESNSAATKTGSANGAGSTQFVSLNTHLHKVNLTNANPIIIPSYHEPTFRMLLCGQALSDGELPDGIIGMFNGTNNTVPVNWARYDAMNDYFLKLTANTAYVNNTGGVSITRHNDTNHTHTPQVGQGTTLATADEGTTAAAYYLHLHTWTISNNSIGVPATTAKANYPVYKTVIFVKYTKPVAPTSGDNFSFVELAPDPVEPGSPVWLRANWTLTNQIKNYTSTLFKQNASGWFLVESDDSVQSFTLSFDETNKTTDFENPSANQGSYTYRPGVNGYEIVFATSGTADHINYSGLNNYDNDYGTITFWLNNSMPAGSAPNSEIIAIDNASAIPRLGITQSDYDGLTYNLNILSKNASGINPVDIENKLLYNQRYYIALTWNGSNMSLYVNSALQWESKFYKMETDAMNVRIGDNTGGDGYYSIDDLQIVDYVKTWHQLNYEMTNTVRPYAFSHGFAYTNYFNGDNLTGMICGYDNTSYNAGCKNSTIVPVRISTSNHAPVWHPPIQLFGGLFNTEWMW